jgi:hypothetical protein
MYLPEPDKTLHFAAGTLAAAFGALAAIMAQLLGHEAAPWLCALASCLFAAFAREAYNVKFGGRWSWRDIAATLAGGAPVIVPVALL